MPAIFVMLSAFWGYSETLAGPSNPLVVQSPPLIGWDLGQLSEIRKGYSRGLYRDDAAVKKLLRDAESALNVEPLAVTFKNQAPPSGNKNDFISVSPFVWPNPTSSDGLPYIYRDGVTNLENAKNFPDWENFISIRNRIESLALASFITNEDRFAAKAEELIRVWFVDPQTKMTPHLKFGHSHPGVVDGHPTGIIVLVGFHNTLDSVSLLRLSKKWSLQVDTGFKFWVREMANWLETSEFGQMERNGRSNHSTHFSGTLGSMKYFLGDKRGAAAEVQEAKSRIAWQIESDGRQPKELDRSISLHYSIYNIQGYVLIARLGERVGIDVWNYTSADGRSLKKAFDYVVRPAFGLTAWPHRQIEPYEPYKRFVPILRQVTARWPDPIYKDILDNLPGEWKTKPRERLLYSTANATRSCSEFFAR